MRDIRLSSLSDCVVFFDFDNTITHFDVLDDIVKHFSVNRDWIAYEKAWHRKEISSKECLEGQLASLRVTKKGLLRYISKIKIDPHFSKLVIMIRREGLRPVILSDSFNFIIDAILKNNGIKGVRVFANSLRFHKNRITPVFPYRNNRCFRCAHCKKKRLLKKNIEDKILIYIGDGHSDICPAEYCDLVFAKGHLLEHCRKTKKLCVAFKKLDDIYNYFEGLEK